ncbi:MAG: hypothetical protein AAGA48_31630 [Myxococcota bacterium]
MDEPSPLKNFAGGGGCGCGCLGLLVVLVGLVAMLGVPLEVYAESDENTALIVGGVAAGLGVFTFLVGGAAYVGSLFLR